LKPKTLPVLEQCVECGVELGFRRAFKHNDNPTEAQIKAAVTSALMDEFYEWFDFPHQENLSEN
jgi:hypothetical protein